jgi:hypothetical protein
MRLDGTGSPSIGWASDGVPISNSGSHTYGSVRALDIMPDGAGNAFVVWCDATETPARVFVQKLVPSGPAAPVSGVGTLAWLRRTGTPSGSTTSGLFWLRTGVRDRSSPLAIEFSLSEPSMAHLELLDVSGRRLIDRDVSGLGLGTHRVDLAQGRPLPPGLYFVRLRQGDHSASLKRVVIP